VTTNVRRYEIGGLIAQGGMAEIVAACAVSEAGVTKRVALKRIRTDRSADPVFVARFFDEARLAMQLSHANVVQVFDFGRTEEDEFFLAMEFVEGVDLQRLRRTPGHGQLPPAEALHVVAQALRGLDYAHRRTDAAGQPLNIVHLDVKPANVLLSFEGEVKLTDFGVACSRDAQRPEAGISGTIPFMSPEQARGEPVDLRSDVYSAAVLLYALVSGVAPFGEEDPARTLELLRSGAPAPVLLTPEAHGLSPLLSKALSSTPERRFETAGAFADAIEELIYAQGWRSGAGALRERLERAFPGERTRLDALFAPGTRSAGLTVARPASGNDGTLLSRIPEVQAPVRQTQLARPSARPRRRVALATLPVIGAAAILAIVHLANRGAGDLGADAAQPAVVATATAPVDAAAPPDQPDAAAIARDAAAEPAIRPEAPQPMGTLTVNASPWGTVYVNNKLAGTTPLLRYPVRAGQVAVTIDNPKLGRRIMQVKVLPRRDTPLIVDLRAPEGAR
jgi:serine/threonine-protein kinase